MQTINVRNLLWLIFLRDWPWKLLSLAIALMIYFSVRAEISNLKTIAVPVMGDVGFVMTSSKPQTVHVTLRGSETELSQLYTPSIFVAVASTSKGTNEIETIHLKASSLRQIGRLRVVRIDPDFVNVRFEHPPLQEPPVSPTIPPPVLTNQPSVEPKSDFKKMAAEEQTSK